MDVKYDPKEYWEHRLSKKLDLTTVGHSGLGYVYNHWLYRARFRAMHQALRNLNLDVSGKSLLDMGVGSGAWIPFWIECNISRLVGIDITSSSIYTLRNQYPQFDFFQGDIGDRLPYIKDHHFDIVTAFDVLFHIVDDKHFSNAITNISRFTKKSDWVIICDSFCKTPWGPYFHEYHRTYDDYYNALDIIGLNIVHIEPIFVSMTTTLCDLNLGYMRLLNNFTKLTLSIVNKLSSRKSTEWINHMIGFTLYVLDAALCRTAETGPSLKILFAKQC